MPTPPTSGPTSRVSSRPNTRFRSTPRWPNRARWCLRPTAAGATAPTAQTPPTPTWWSRSRRPGLCPRRHRRLARPILSMGRALILRRIGADGAGSGLYPPAARWRLGNRALPAQWLGAGPSLAPQHPPAPRFWRYIVEPREFAPTVLGWRYERLGNGKSAFEGAEAKSRVYDTALPGYDNGGHQFVDMLSDTERTAAIECLKTL